MLISYSKLAQVRTLFADLGVHDTNYGVFEEFSISRPTFAPIAIAELHKDTPAFLFYSLKSISKTITSIMIKMTEH